MSSVIFTSTSRQIVKHYWHEVRRYPWFWIPAVLLVPLGVFLINFAEPYIVAHVIDTLSSRTVQPHEVWDTFGPWIIAFIAAAVVGELGVWRLLVWLIWNLEKRVVFGLYQKSFAKLSAQSANFHAARLGGSLVSQTNKFVSSYIELANTVTFTILPLLSAIVFTFVILTPRAPLFALGLAILCILFMALGVLSFRRIRDLNTAEAEANSKLGGLISDMITNIMAVKSFGREANESLHFRAANQKAQAITQKVIKATIARDLGFGSLLVAGSIFMFLILVGGPSKFGITIGTLILIASYSFAIFNRLWSFNNILRDTNRALGNAAPMAAIVDSELEVQDPEHPEPVRISDGTIVFRDMRFAHADARDTPLFEHFTLAIAGGEKVGLVGHSGSGKTSLTKLLLRFADVDAGEVTIDGQNIAAIKQTDLRQHIAYVPQEPLLFHRTIAENIAYGKVGATPREIKEAARKANALGFIEKLPKGLQTVVGERGAKLSGGQRQRIAIARAILKDAPILVLDEATSALDSESEALIQEALVALMKGRTAIVIAHRLSTIQNMDRIIMLGNGKILEEGTHKQLVRRKGAYAKLWARQSGGFVEE
ncbi:MAG TPA: ABC transporter ATP-binding protein [Candidatus Saccharimonadales bacterium]|nr:ABC transporter ATP-binding protein [Candidatus Saccharimonadales bacterium]